LGIRGDGVGLEGYFFLVMTAPPGVHHLLTGNGIRESGSINGRSHEGLHHAFYLDAVPKRKCSGGIVEADLKSGALVFFNTEIEVLSYKIPFLTEHIPKGSLRCFTFFGMDAEDPGDPAFGQIEFSAEGAVF